MWTSGDSRNSIQLLNSSGGDLSRDVLEDVGLGKVSRRSALPSGESRFRGKVMNLPEFVILGRPL
jgi:hypothetical protein